MLMSNQCFAKGTCKKYLEGANGWQCDKQEEFCTRLFKLESLYSQSCLTPDQYERIALRVDADNTDKEEFIRLSEIASDICNFVNNGNNLYIYSEVCGNGKTAWSVRLLQEFFNKIWWSCDLECHGLFVNVPRFFLALKNNISSTDEYAQHIKQNVLKADIVVWDDLATKGITEFENENLLSIIDDRMNNRKANVFTSNIAPPDLPDMIGQRLYSRIVNFSEIIHLRGKDKRNLKFN